MERYPNKKRITRNVLIPVFLLLISIPNLNGQIQKKTLMVGGELDFSVVTSGYHSLHFTLAPTVGYFVVNNLAIGAELEANYWSFTDANSTTFGIGPLFRYYFGGDKVMGFCHFSYLGSISTHSFSDEKDASHRIQPGLGLNLQILPSVGIEALATFNYDIALSDSYFDFRVGFQVYIPPTNLNR